MRTPQRSRPVLDTSTVATLQMGGEASLREIVEGFVSDAAARLARLRAAVARRAGDQITREARGLKSGARGVGAARLAGLCEAIEQYARDGKATEAGILVHAVEPAFEEVRRALVDLSFDFAD